MESCCDKANLKARLASIGGHIEAIKRIHSCNDIMMQLFAVESAVHKACKKLMEEHISDCIAEDVKTGNLTSMNELKSILDTYL